MTEAAVTASGIRVGIVYNTFKPEEVEFHTLPYSPGATIRDYVGDLADGTWSVGYRGQAYHPGEWDELTLEDGEAFSFVQVPESGGSGGGKDIMRMVAMIAVMVVAYAVVGPWAAGLIPEAGMLGMSATMAGNMAAGIAMASFSMAGMMVVNALIPPAMPTMKSGDGKSYGIDGPKNTAKEGVVTPISFGKVRIGGNVVDSFTKLHGDTQYLYLRVILNDGKIKSASEFEINGEPLSNYQNVETRVSLGGFEGQENDWFGEAIRMKSVGTELQTTWLTRTTETEVDRVRVDLLYPEGLGYWKDDGKVLQAESEVAFEYRKVGDTAWQPLRAGHNYTFFGMSSGASAMPGYSEKPPSYGGGSVFLHLGMIKQNQFGQPEVLGEFYGNLNAAMQPHPQTGVEEPVGYVPVPQGGGRVTVTALAQVKAPADASVGTYDMSVWYREVGATTWTRFGGEKGNIERSRSGQDWATFPLVYRSYSVALDPAKRYEVTAFGGTLTNAEVFISNLNSNGQIFLYRSKEESFRYSYESGVLPRGRYEVRVRRIRPKEDNRKRKDTVFWQDMAEIDVENIHYVGTANVSLKIKVDDQINSIPTFTSMIEASVVDQFDADGNLVTNDWSPWPVWHVLDILLNSDRGRGISPSRIDFASAKEWEEHCIKHNLQFNGIFDQKSNVWDAIQKICRVGHAQIVRNGTKYSFVVDKPSEPVQLFNDANIIEGTFSTTWLPMTERANEIQYTFYPEEDGFKEKMLRVIDPDAQNSGAPLRVAKITEFGVTNYEQARFNIEKQLRENKLIRKSVSFDAPIESIGLTIGDVALIQHSSAHYGKGIGQGRLKVGSTRSRLMLDAPVTMDPAKTYKVLIVHPAVKRYTVNIENIIHNTAYVSGLPSGAIETCTRLKQGDVDVRIDDVRDGNPLDRIIVSDGSVLKNGVAELWATDVIDEREVVYAAGEQEELVLASPLVSDPTTHATWMVGPVETVKAPYRLRAISGSDIYRRSLTFIEYNELVYAPMGTPITPPSVAPSQIPAHVLRPSISYPAYVDGQQTRVTARVSWEKADVLYAGADIYVARDGRPFAFVRSVADVTSFEMEMSIGEDIQVRIVAFGTNGRRANVNTAPVVASVVRPGANDLPRPLELEVALESYKLEAAIIADWKRPEELDASIQPTYRAQLYVCKDEAEFDSINLVDQKFPDPSKAPIDVADDSTEWRTVGTTQETYLTIPRLEESKIVVRVRTEAGRSRSPYTYVKFDLLAPALPAGVRKLALNGVVGGSTFNGKDAEFSWLDVLEKAEEEVAPLSAAGAVFDQVPSAVKNLGSYSPNYVTAKEGSGVTSVEYSWLGQYFNGWQYEISQVLLSFDLTSSPKRPIKSAYIQFNVSEAYGLNVIEARRHDPSAGAFDFTPGSQLAGKPLLGSAAVLDGQVGVRRIDLTGIDPQANVLNVVLASAAQRAGVPPVDDDTTLLMNGSYTLHVEYEAEEAAPSGPQFSEHQWQDYQVSVFEDGGDQPLRVEYTRNPNWSYTFEKNAHDSAPLADRTARRKFRVEVRIRDKAGRLSDAEAIVATNPQQGMVAVNVQRVDNTIKLTYDRPATVDFGGIRVLATETPGAEPTTVVHQGDGYPVIQLPAAIGATGPNYFVKWAFFDVFDMAALDYSTVSAFQGQSGIDPSEIEDLINDATGGMKDAQDRLEAAQRELAEAMAASEAALKAAQDALRQSVSDANASFEAALEGLIEEVDGVQDAQVSIITQLDGKATKIDLNATVSRLDDQVAKVGQLTTVVNDLPTEFVSVSSFNTLSSEIANARGGTANLAARFTAQQKTITDGLAGKASVEDFADLESELSTANLTISGHAGRLSKVETDVAGKASSKDLTTLDNTVKGINTTVSGHASRLMQVETDVAGKASSQDFTTLSNTVTGINTAVSGHASRLTKVETDVAGKASSQDVTNLSNTVSGLNTTVSGHANRLTKVETDVSGAAKAKDLTDLGVVVNLKGRTFRQNAQPANPTNGVALVSGDRWVNTSAGANNEEKVWTGSAWASIADPRIASTASTVAAHANRLTEVEVDVGTRAKASDLNTLSTNYGSFVTATNSRLSSVETTANGAAKASTVEALSVKVNGFEGSIDATRAIALDAQGKVNASYRVKLDGNGVATGFESYLNGTIGGFKVRADLFEVVPTGTGARTEFSAGAWKIYDAAGRKRVHLGMK